MSPSPASREITRQSGSNFAWSFFFLPRERRHGITTVYALCRLVDDAVDEAPDERTARAEVERWRRRLDSCFNGVTPKEAEDPLIVSLMEELRETVRRFSIRRDPFEDLLKGVAMDLEHKRYATLGDLETYCYYVAGTIGLLCNAIFGVAGEEARTYALRLGTAFQMTNILRDVGSDAGRGRIYLPLEDLARFGVSEGEILRGRMTPPLRCLLEFQAERAKGYFEQAEALLPQGIRRRIVPAEMMRSFYQKILQKIVREGFPVLERKVTLTRAEKVGLLVKVLWRSFGYAN